MLHLADFAPQRLNAIRHLRIIGNFDTCLYGRPEDCSGTVLRGLMEFEVTSQTLVRSVVLSIVGRSKVLFWNECHSKEFCQDMVVFNHSAEFPSV